MLVWLPERIYHRLDEVAPVAKVYLDQLNREFSQTNSFVEKVKMVQGVDENPKYIEAIYILDNQLDLHEQKILNILTKDYDSETLKNFYENHTEHPLVRAYAFYFNSHNIDIAKIGLEEYEKTYLSEGLNLFRKEVQDKDVRIWLKEFQFSLESATIRMLSVLSISRLSAVTEALEIFRASCENYIDRAYETNKKYGVTKEYVREIFEYKHRVEVLNLFSLIIQKSIAAGGSEEEIQRRLKSVRDYYFENIYTNYGSKNRLIFQDLTTYKKLVEFNQSYPSIEALAVRYFCQQVYEGDDWFDLFKHNVSFEKDFYQFIRSLNTDLAIKETETNNQDWFLLFGTEEQSNPIAKELGLL